MAKGIIYVCSTVVDGLIKIGKTGSENYEQRMTNLESNGYRNITGLKRQFAIEVDNYDEKETLIDTLFSRNRVGNTELFSLNINDVIQLLSSFKGNQIYPDPEIQTQEDVFAINSEKSEINSGVVPNGIYKMEMTSQDTKNKVSGTLNICNGVLTLLKGAKIGDCKERKKMTYYDKYHQLKIENGVLQEDVLCDSFSMAASLVCGHNTNGWDKWKDSNSNKIDVYRKKQFEED